MSNRRENQGQAMPDEYARKLLARIRQYRGQLPADFKFDREEASERTPVNTPPHGQTIAGMLTIANPFRD